VEALSRAAEWLVGSQWGLDGGLYLDAVIRAHGHDYEVRLSYPTLFPDAPIVVRPRNLTHRISSHQYGDANGPLCLEWGPDNWHRDITAVQMLESAYRLFHTENPLGQNRPAIPVVAPSRHHLEVGQELRGEWARWYGNQALADLLASQPTNSAGGFKFSFRKAGEIWIALVHEATPLGGNAWKNGEIPTTLCGAEPNELDVGVWFKTDLENASIGQPNKLVDLKALLASVDGERLLATDGGSPVEGFHRPIAGVLIMDKVGGMHLFVVLSGESIIACACVQSDAVPGAARAPEARELSGRKVGIVGLGSAGSKIAVSLARMGVREFYLVDHDVMLPENLRRHALDWLGVVQHKANAMAAAIGRVAPDVNVEVCRLHLAGQESNASVSGALDKLAGCDLLIDATANPNVFNLLAAVARTASRPLVWLEVFGGGIGGMVARSRPGADPTPQDMRGAYLQYCSDNPDPTVRNNSTNYEMPTETGEVLVASDADIAVIAHHAVRFVPDCFVPAEQSKFPHSMYLIGLAKAWVFEAPFVTVPISTERFNAAGWSKAKETDITPENAAFLLGLLQKSNNDEATHPA
jgi:molybdopterin/thiamine biosynthesis adenylyltransferase